MASLKTEGTADVALMFGKLASAGVPIAKMTVYDGARVMADEIRREIGALPEDKERHLHGGEKYAVITRRDKQDLAKHLGITKITYSSSGTRAVIGFAGYGSKKTKKYKKGLPMALLARSLMKGTSVREKSAFIDRAVSKASDKAQSAMIATATKAIARIVAE
ncbi:MAG: hypothetical protein IJ418_09080 [Clostridia bacterium]|nr:hypothetical protein [Clostridia bacterium]